MRRNARWAIMLSIIVVGVTGAVSAQVAVTYFGHSCFTIQEAEGPIIMLDPYATFVKYPGLPQPADIVLMTHAHIDHCPPCYGENDRVLGNPVIEQPWDAQGSIIEGTREIGGLLFRFTEATHVTTSGGGAGTVALISFEVGGIRFAHLGDLGRTLTPAQVQALEDVDVVFLPVGGAFTVNAQEAVTVIGQLESAKIVIPMHYFVADRTPWTQIAPLSSFIAAIQEAYPVSNQETYRIELELERLPQETEVWILEYFGG